MKFESIRPLIDEAFENGEEFEFCPNGISMLPFIKGGKDVIKIKKYDGGAKKYDVVFYVRPDGKYVLHRIVRVKGDELYMCGDNLWWVEHVPEEDIFAILSSVKGKKMCGAGYFLYCRTLFARRFVFHAVSYIKRHLGGKRK